MSNVAYADGGCSPNPGPGGWGVLIRTPDGEVELWGGEAASTNNRMELTAAIKALEHFPAGSAVEMRCDSRYVIDSMTKWVAGWRRNGWRSTTGDVKNRDLVERLDALTRARQVRWTWLKGHAGEAGNERADRLVARGRAGAALGQADGRSDRAGPATPDSPSRATSAPSPRAGSVAVDLSLGLELARAAKGMNISTEEYVDRALRLALRLGPDALAPGAAP